MSNRVYRYGLLPPTQNAVLVREQMRLAHTYRNVLTEIERGRRAALRSVDASYEELRTLERAVADADAAIEEALKAVKAARAATRTRSETSDMRERVKMCRTTKKEAVRALKERRMQLRQDAHRIAAADAINERASELQRSARAHCGVYWGTYLLVEDAMQAAREAPLYDGAEPNDPRFVRWTGDGRVGVQLQGGLAAEKVFGSDTRFHIDSVDERAWYSPVRGERRRQSRTVLYLRVGSDEKKEPIWASWPMVMHRPLPAGSIVKRVTVTVRKRGPREEWSAELTLDTENVRTPDRGQSGVVAVDLGWRIMGDEIRVAMWRSELGDGGELRLDARTISGLRKPEELRSIRDRSFNEARDAFAKWLVNRQVPEWLREAAKHLGQWRSPNRLASLALRWRKNRWDGDEEGYGALEAWRYNDYHLWQWEIDQRTGSLRHRREVYRRFAASLARRFKTLVLEQFDLRRLARLQPPEAEMSENKTARSSRQLVAPSDLRQSLINAFSAEGGEVVYVPAFNTTRTCPSCSKVEKFDAATFVSHACSACGAIWDQDDAAAINLLARFEQSSDDQNSGTARKPEKTEGRWARARKLHDEARMRKDGARKEVCNGSES